MNSRRTIVSPVLAVVLFASSASSVHSSAQSRSDADIDAIGHRNVGKGIDLYSLENEKALGKQLAQEVERSSKLLDDPIVTEYINRIAQKIAQNSDARFPVTIRVIDSDVAGSLSLPGGFQYVNVGLILQTQGEGELAGVLAQGIAHTALRSATKLAIKGELMQLSSVPIIQLGPGGWSGPGVGQGQTLAIPLTQLKFRRDAEREADYFGLQYAYQAGYDPECLPRFIERTSPLPAGVTPVPKTFDMFPPAPERVKDMRKEIAKILPHRDGAIVTTPEFQEIQEHLRARKAKQGLSPEHDPATDPAFPNRHGRPQSFECRKERIKAAFGRNERFPPLRCG